MKTIGVKFLHKHKGFKMKKELREIDLGQMVVGSKLLIDKDETNKRVLCLWDNQYVVWSYNAETQSVHGGHYYGNDLAQASSDFTRNKANAYWSKDYIREGN